MKDFKSDKHLFIGRFQPFHLGHLEVVKQILPKTQQLILGLWSTNQKVSLHNPLSYWERKIIIGHILSKHLPLSLLKKIKFTPIPDTKTDLQRKNIIEKKHPQHLIVTGNSRLKDIFGEKVLWLPTRFDGISATQIRQFLIKGDINQALKYLPAGFEKFLPFLKDRLKKLKNL